MHNSSDFRSLHIARFQSEPAIFAAPGRVNLIGEHTDYAEGFVMPAAIDFATLAGISPRSDGKIVIYSENYGQERTFDALELPTGAGKHWTDYPLGVVSIFAGEGYASGYYNYIWADTLVADAAEAFREAPGGFYDAELARKLHDDIISVGNTVDAGEAFRRFRGRDVRVEALMRDRGFPA